MLKNGGGALKTHLLRPRARLVALIGEELISDEPVAIVELVKNSYDADASSASIKFIGKDPYRPRRIVVEDDGIGMDLETILGAWLEPGTISKRFTDTSPGGRTYQGAKGIGRFAAARLANILELRTKRSGGEGIYVHIDWRDFEGDKYLDEIDIDYGPCSMPGIYHGTHLVLDDIKKPWTDSDYNELHARLSRLISPFSEIKGFTVKLEIPGYPELSGEVNPPDLILKPKYKFSGSLDKKGRFNGWIEIDGKKLRSIEDRKLDVKDSNPLCGPFEVEIRAWDRDREGLQQFLEKGMGIQQVRRTLDSYCGVSIYRNGFRVHPYGQRGNDWLNLDLRSRQNPVMRLANNQIIGAIKISRDNNPGLTDRSTREGMILNVHHASLEKWFIEILKILEEERYRIRPRRKSAPEQQMQLFEFSDISDVVSRSVSQLGREHPLTVAVKGAEKQIKEGTERLQEVFSRLLLSSGLGHMVDIVIHEIGSPLGKINRALDLLEAQIREHINDKDVLEEIIEILSSIRGWLVQIHNLRDRLDPQTPAKRGRAVKFDVYEAVQDTFDLYEAIITKQAIDYRLYSDVRPLNVLMSRASFDQIIVNLLDNSLYWVIKEKGRGRGGRIRVDIECIEHGFRVALSDNGPGVPEEDRNNIFEPYFTTKPNGMGLGLYISRLLIEPYGKLTYGDDSRLKGACFEATFERGVGV